MKKSKKSIISTIFTIMFSGTFLIIALFAVITFYNTYHNYLHNVDNLYEVSLEQQKTMIRNEVEKVIFYVTKMKEHFETYEHHELTSQEQLQDIIIDILIDLRFGKEGYFFGSAAGGEPLFSNGVITKGTGSVWELSDPDGIKIIQEQLKALEKPEGVFVRYSWHKLNDSKPTPKVSYSKAIPEWNWIIGAGVYLEDINEIVLLNKILLFRQLKNQVLEFLLLFALYALISFFITNRISAKFTKSINTLTLFFRDAADKYIPIDNDLMVFDEFKVIADAANQMIEKQKTAEEALRKSELKYKNLTEIQKDVMITTTLDGHLTYCSPNIKDFAGYDPEKELGNCIDDYLVNSNEIALLEEITGKILAGGKADSIELSFRSASGILLSVDVSIAPVIENDEIVSFNAIIRDISQRKKIETELENYRLHLEELVQERTRELKTKNQELETMNEQLNNMNKVFTGREFRIKELRDRVKELENKLSGQA